MLNQQEFFHLIKQAAAQQMQDIRTTHVGHISTYDPSTNNVRCVLPSLTDENGNPIVSPWMPLGSAMVGPGYGIKYHPKGGATPDNPAAGEMCIVQIVDRDSGFGCVANLMFSSAQPAPNPDSVPGEYSITNEIGSLIRLYPNGDITIGASSNLILGAGGDVIVAAGNNLLMSADKTASLDAERIATRSEKETQLEAGSKMNFLSQDTMSLATNKNMNLTAYENMGLQAQETLASVAKNITFVTEEDYTVASNGRMVQVSQHGASFSSSETVNINAEKQVTVRGGQRLYLTSDAINIFTTFDRKGVPDTSQVKRVRPKGWDEIGKWKAGNGTSSPDGGGTGNITPAQSTGPFGNPVNSSTEVNTRVHSSGGKLFINGQLQEITTAGQEAFQTDTTAQSISWDGVPVYGYDATLDKARYGGGIAGPSRAETISGPGSIPQGAAPTFKPAGLGEIFIDARVRIKDESEKIEEIARKEFKLDAFDTALINSRRLMGIASPSLKIRAVNKADSDLTLIGSRINITTDLAFTDSAQKEIKISTPANANMNVKVGGILDFDVEKDCIVGANENIVISSTGTTSIQSYQDMTINSSAHGLNLGAGQSGDITIWNTGTTYMNTDGVFAFSGADTIYRRLLDERFLTAYNAHTHGGVSSGASNTNAPTAVTSSNVCTDILKGA